MGKGREQKENTAVPLRERIGTWLGIPADAVGLTNGFMAELRGQRTVTVRGCRRILTYSPEAIRLDTRDGEIVIVGEELTCIAYSADSIGIEGRIGGVYFDRFAKTLLGRLQPSASLENER